MPTVYLIVLPEQKISLRLRGASLHLTSPHLTSSHFICTELGSPRVGPVSPQCKDLESLQFSWLSPLRSHVAKTAFSEKHWLLSWAHTNELKSGKKAWNPCLHFVPVFAVILEFRKDRADGQHLYDSEPHGQTTLKWGQSLGAGVMCSTLEQEWSSHGNKIAPLKWWQG
jgi:hypothetical protein